MAVKYKEVKNELETAVLNEEELELIEKLENHIDRVIKTEFDNSKIRIELGLVNFKQNPPLITVNLFAIKDTRKQLMRKELERRYAEAGWKYTVETDSSYQGCDYWVLSGK